MEHGIGPNQLRLVIALIGAVVLALIYLFGRPSKPGQGKRTTSRPSSDERVEPTLGEAGADGQGPYDDGLQHELDRLGDSISADRSVDRPSPRTQVGARPDASIERIVTLFVAARAGIELRGSDLIVAAEKCGLEFGDLGIFHRLVDGKPEAGPIFSVASMVKPGSFDMSRIDSITTPGVSFFMALPGPLQALDAWDTMLPAAQRLAELLDAQVLDEERNTMGRQRVAHIREEMRAWDRKQESSRIRPSW